MGKELKSGANTERVESHLSKSLKRKLKAYCEEANTSIAQVIRDHAQALTKDPKPKTKKSK